MLIIQGSVSVFGDASASDGFMHALSDVDVSNYTLDRPSQPSCPRARQ